MEKDRQTACKCNEYFALAVALCNELEEEIWGRYQGLLHHPTMKRQFDRDMNTVYEAKKILGITPPEKS